MMDLGELFSGGLSLVGGLLGYNSSQKQLKESQRQFGAQMDYAKNQVQYRVEDALKAGINPLAALGVSSNVSPTFNTSGSDNSLGRGIAGLGRSIRDAFRSKIEDEQESRALDLESKRIENEINRTRLLEMTQPGIPTNTPEVSVPTPTGEKSLFQPVYDLQGRPRLMVNQDVTENDSDNAGYRSSLASALLSGQINPLTGHVRSKQLRMLLDDMYYDQTGRHISNLDELYISPTEIGFVAGDEVKDLVSSIRGGKRGASR